MNQFDSSDIVIHDIDPIQYHRDVIHPIEFTGERFFISMGFNPELLRKKKNETMILWKSIFSHLLLLHCSF